MQDFKADLIIPCDDDAVADLHDLCGSDADLRSLIERSLGSMEYFPILESRELVLQTAADLGILVPETRGISRQDDLRSWDFSRGAALKLDRTSGGSGVVLVHSHAEAVTAFHELNRLRQKRSNARMTLQQFIKGRPANTMFACWSGELLGVETVQVFASKGPTGAAIIVGSIQSEEANHAAESLTRKLGLSGFFGLDFILEEGTGRPYLIELNPRMTQLGHLRLSPQGDLANLLGAKLREEAPVPPTDCIREATVALFPHALKWDRKKRYLNSSFHDVPVNDPGLYDALLRDAWPERSPISHLYHLLGLPRWRKMFTWDDSAAAKN